MMISYFEKRHNSLPYRILSTFIVFSFIFSLILPPGYAQLVPASPAGGPQALLNLPAPGMMVTPSAAFTPALINGITIHPENPLEFDFIVGTGDENLQGKAFEDESTKLIKYFLASLTVPEDEMWVNLSPYEKDRIIPEGFGTTEMGRDLLAQDYILKQLTASLMYPEKELGSEFWKKIYQKAYEEYGTTEIPVNTFNKVWIVPEKAVVYEHGNSAFVVKSRLKVMLEEDYNAVSHNVTKSQGHQENVTGDVVTGDVVTTGIIREVILPEIEHEVNEGKSFANLRQIYNSAILAAWFKQKLKVGTGRDQSLLGQVYVDKAKTKGVDVEDKTVNQKIYAQYLEAFKKGVYNYIKEDYDPATQEIIPRKYFSGGTNLKVGDLVETYKKGLPLTREHQEVLGEYLANLKEYNLGQRRVNVNLVELSEEMPVAQAQKLIRESQQPVPSPAEVEGVKEDVLVRIKEARRLLEGLSAKVEEGIVPSGINILKYTALLNALRAASLKDGGGKDAGVPAASLLNITERKNLGFRIQRMLETLNDNANTSEEDKKEITRALNSLQESLKKFKSFENVIFQEASLDEQLKKVSRAINLPEVNVFYALRNAVDNEKLADGLAGVLGMTSEDGLRERMTAAGMIYSIGDKYILRPYFVTSSRLKKIVSGIPAGIRGRVETAILDSVDANNFIAGLAWDSKKSEEEIVRFLDEQKRLSPLAERWRSFYARESDEAALREAAEKAEGVAIEFIKNHPTQDGEFVLAARVAPNGKSAVVTTAIQSPNERASRILLLDLSKGDAGVKVLDEASKAQYNSPFNRVAFFDEGKAVTAWNLSRQIKWDIRDPENPRPISWQEEETWAQEPSILPEEPPQTQGLNPAVRSSSPVVEEVNKLITSLRELNVQFQQKLGQLPVDSTGEQFLELKKIAKNMESAVDGIESFSDADSLGIVKVIQSVFKHNIIALKRGSNGADLRDFFNRYLQQFQLLEFIVDRGKLGEIEKYYSYGTLILARTLLKDQPLSPVKKTFFDGEWRGNIESSYDPITDLTTHFSHGVQPRGGGYIIPSFRVTEKGAKANRPADEIMRMYRNGEFGPSSPVSGTPQGGVSGWVREWAEKTRQEDGKTWKELTRLFEGALVGMTTEDMESVKIVLGGSEQPLETALVHFEEDILRTKERTEWTHLIRGRFMQMPAVLSLLTGAGYFEARRGAAASLQKDSTASHSPTSSLATARVEEIKGLLQEIEKERQTPGSGNLPQVAVLSDFHGGLNRFIMLLNDVLNNLAGFQGQLDPNWTIEEQLTAQGLSFKDIKGQIVLGGDILDRGKHGIKIFLLIKELVEKGEGKVVSVTGNHDFWAFANLLGLHIPWYKGFQFYGDTEAENLIARYRQMNPELFDTPESVSWWTQRLAEHNADQDAYQKKAFEGKVKEVRNRFIEDYKAYQKNWTDPQKDAVEKFIGYFARIGVTDPYVGLNGLGKTSDLWWKQVLNQINQGYEARRSLGAEDAELSVWQEAIALAEKISHEVNGRLDQALKDGKWWYRVFESINTHAYRSVEWSAKDWSSHKGWGDSVIGEINEMIDAGLIREEKLTQKKYIQSPTLQALARFYRENFNLYALTPYGDLFSHGGFPVSSDGTINILYKGVAYKGKEIFNGLSAVSNDVKDTEKSLQEIWEALHLVNTWYADMTTELKPAYIKRNIDQIGISKINKGIGVRHHVTGHNPIALGKLAGRPFMAGDSGYTHAFADFGMSEKYGGQGGWVSMGAGGIKLRGFESETSDALVDNPDTHVWDKETGQIKKTIENPGLEGDIFLSGAKEQLSEELARLEASSPVGEERIPEWKAIFLTHSSRFQRTFAAHMLGELLTGNMGKNELGQDVVNTLIVRLKEEEDSGVRLGIVLALGKIGGEKAAAALRDTMVADERNFVRDAARDSFLGLSKVKDSGLETVQADVASFTETNKTILVLDPRSDREGTIKDLINEGYAAVGISTAGEVLGKIKEGSTKIPLVIVEINVFSGAEGEKDFGEFLEDLRKESPLTKVIVYTHADHIIIKDLRNDFRDIRFFNKRGGSRLLLEGVSEVISAKAESPSAALPMIGEGREARDRDLTDFASAEDAVARAARALRGSEKYLLTARDTDKDLDALSDTLRRFKDVVSRYATTAEGEITLATKVVVGGIRFDDNYEPPFIVIHVSIKNALENEFLIRIPWKIEKNFTTVGDYVRFIAEQSAVSLPLREAVKDSVQGIASQVISEERRIKESQEIRNHALGEPFYSQVAGEVRLAEDRFRENVKKIFNNAYRTRTGGRIERLKRFLNPMTAEPEHILIQHYLSDLGKTESGEIGEAAKIVYNVISASSPVEVVAGAADGEGGTKRLRTFVEEALAEDPNYSLVEDLIRDLTNILVERKHDTLGSLEVLLSAINFIIAKYSDIVLFIPSGLEDAMDDNEVKERYGPPYLETVKQLLQKTQDSSADDPPEALGQFTSIIEGYLEDSGTDSSPVEELREFGGYHDFRYIFGSMFKYGELKGGWFIHFDIDKMTEFNRKYESGREVIGLVDKIIVQELMPSRGSFFGGRKTLGPRIGDGGHLKGWVDDPYKEEGFIYFEGDFPQHELNLKLDKVLARIRQETPVRISLGALNYSQMRNVFASATSADEFLHKLEITLLDLVEAAKTKGGDRIVFYGNEQENAASLPLVSQGTGDRVQGTEIASNAPGGIDLNPALLDLQIKRDGNGVPLPLPQQPIESMHIEGFLPVIINITPVTNLPLLLGLADTQQDTEETRPAMKAREPEEISALN